MPNSQQPVQEIRFAVVMYGGVSLAIYIHGVAQELLRLARSTSGVADTDLVESIYRELSQYVRPVRNPSAEPVPTRFIIDILSGTSAGGINAIFLAKALALGAKNLDDLRRTWLDVADIGQLLNLANPDLPKRSLLNGDWMYQQLHLAFDRMNPPAPPSPSAYQESDRLDLFVTTTDLNGVALPLRLSDMDTVEKTHKGVFHFCLDRIQLTNRPTPSALDRTLDDLRRNDFVSALDPMLAFAARATSSFPVAFAPAKLADIAPIIGTAKYDEGRSSFLKFFRWVPKNPLVPTASPVDIEHRELADGGYLNNKPFDHAINALTFRATRLPHSRKLLFVDPFPELAGDQKDKEHFTFVENAIDAAMTLPRYQTIRQEIQRIKDLNRTLLRLGEIHSRAGSANRASMRAFAELPLSELVKEYGAAYSTYHAVRLFDTTDDLARIVSGVQETDADDDLFLAVRYLVRAWRVAAYSAESEAGKLTETKFFTDYDYSFRLRRAIHLLEWAQTRPGTASDCESLIRQITRLIRKRDQLASTEPGNPLAGHIRQLDKFLSWHQLKSILGPLTDAERLDRAAVIYNGLPGLKALAQAIAAEWQVVFDQNRSELRACFKTNPDLSAEYERFDFGDMVTLAFLEGSNVSEHTGTEVYRVSPADGTRTKPEGQIDLNKKLAGYKLGDFGAFLKRDFRLNDMLFGRLDACERIVSAIFNQDCDAGLRDRYVQSLQRAIISQECDGGMNSLAPVVASSLTPAQALHNFYALPPDPEPKDSAKQIANASNILGRMFEDDANQTNRIFSFLKTIGKLGASLVSFLTPRSLPSLFFQHWLALAALSSLLLYGIALVFKQPKIETLGLYGVGGTLVIWLLAWLIGRYLTRLPVPRWFKMLLASLASALTIAVILSGLHHVWPDLLWIWDKAIHRFHEFIGW